MSATCRLCGHHANDLPSGSFLARVNEKGVPGIWECRPKCPTTEVFHVVSGRFTSTEPNFRDIPRTTGVKVMFANPKLTIDLGVANGVSIPS